MAEAISNTSPLFYLHQIGALDWLPRLFSDVWISNAIIQELAAGRAAMGLNSALVRGFVWLSRNVCRRKGWHWTSGRASCPLWHWLKTLHNRRTPRGYAFRRDD